MFKKNIFFVIALLIVGLVVVEAQNTTNLRNYQCKKCSTVIQGNKEPSSLNCFERGQHK